MNVKLKSGEGLTVTTGNNNVVTVPDAQGPLYVKPQDGIPASDLAQAVQNALAPEIFWATYGTTTASEIEAAVAAGKVVLLKTSEYVYYLNVSDSTPHTHQFYALDGNTISTRKLTNDVWSQEGGYDIQTLGNKVDSWQATPDNSHYPSEKLVKDSLDAKQPIIDSSHKLDYALLSNTPTIPDANDFVAKDDVESVNALDVDSTPTANSTHLVTSGGVYAEIHPAVASTQPAGGFLPNVMYVLGTLSGNTTFALASPADANIVNHYYWTFDTSSTAPTITWPAGLTWQGGSAPTINASKHYEVSVLGGIAVAMEV